MRDTMELGQAVIEHFILRMMLVIKSRIGAEPGDLLFRRRGRLSEIPVPGAIFETGVEISIPAFTSPFITTGLADSPC